MPPSLGQLTVNALTAGDAALLATEPRAASVDGLAQITRPVTTIRAHFQRRAGLGRSGGATDTAPTAGPVEWAEQLRADYADTC
jgi:chromosome partitioning protein